MTAPTSEGFQWKRSGTPISGATEAAYKVQPADKGETLTCTVTASNSAGSAVITTAATASVTAGTITLSPIAGFILPGYVNPSFWDPSNGNHALAMELPGQVQAVGGTWVNLQTSYTSESWTSTDVTTTSTTVDDAGIAAMVAKAKSLGLKVCLKPHLSMADGSGTMPWLPGAKFSFVQPNLSGDGTYTPNAKTVTSSHWSLDSGDIGKRIVVLSASAINDIPGCSYGQYGNGPTPTWTTVTGISSAAVAQTSVAPAAYSSGGLIGILDDTAAATGLRNWQSTLMHLLSVADGAGGADAIDLFTEHDWNTRLYATEWRSIIATIKASYPNVEVFAQSVEGQEYQGDIPFADACDYIGFSCYPTIETSPGTAQSTITANWNSAIGNTMSAWSAAWGGKPILFAEVGARSIADAGDNPGGYSGGSAQSPDVDQAAFITGMFDAFTGQSWWGGFMWWTWFAAGNPDTSPYNDKTSYEPKTLSQAEFKRALL